MITTRRTILAAVSAALAGTALTGRASAQESPPPSPTPTPVPLTTNEQIRQHVATVRAELDAIDLLCGVTVTAATPAPATASTPTPTSDPGWQPPAPAAEPLPTPTPTPTSQAVPVGGKPASSKPR